eukprot:TRINITY_DN42397_c0_g1_i1.p1 TRINITY_DN42397_c0_g1~~TRINITY_DN42397_c0_g1_i1.p1  ORF type:complete len:133 (-),score=20.38 TRINITY_DN42397_c0_g1_i1:26-424(-)
MRPNWQLPQQLGAAPSMARPLLGVKDFQETILSTNLSVIFWYTNWCRPCHEIAKKIDELVVELRGSPLPEGRNMDETKFGIFCIDADVASELAELESVRAFPTFHLYRSGTRIAEIKCASIEPLRNVIELFR